MTSRTIRSAILPVTVLFVLSCSKTQDTAPERRVFGDPPSIQTVDYTFDPVAHVECNFSDIVLAAFCADGVTDVQMQTGRGWTVAFDADKSNRHIVFSDQPTTVPGVFIEGHHAEVIFKVKAIDPSGNTDPSPAKARFKVVSPTPTRPPASRISSP